MAAQRPVGSHGGLPGGARHPRTGGAESAFEWGSADGCNRPCVPSLEGVEMSVFCFRHAGVRASGSGDARLGETMRRKVSGGIVAKEGEKEH